MPIHPYCQRQVPISTEISTSTPKPRANANQQPRQYTLNQIRSIYGFPPSLSTAPVVVAVVSFGGGLVGSVSPAGVVTNGDVQRHWTSLGILPQNQPHVIIVRVNNAFTVPNPSDVATQENTIDVEIIGALCPTSNLTILLFIANPYDDFPDMFTAIMNPTIVNGISYTPSIISCSWGCPEIYYSASQLNSMNATLREISNRGITFTAATGDLGSSNGTSTTTADFPSSSPYTVACGGTTLVCPSGIYDSNTVETTWGNGGGGFSRVFGKPAYQTIVPGSKRATPDIALVADPNTGIVFTVGGQLMVIGGTSVVSPAMAAFAAVLNLKQPLTPLLYSCPAICFNDITAGTIGAYFASTGYDNCTGRGSIIGPAIVTYINTPPATVSVSEVSLSGPSSLSVGQTIQVMASISPANATNKSVIFASSDKAVAFVSATGLVSGLAAGTATITVTTSDGSFTSSLTVTVVSIPVTGVTLTAQFTLALGKTAPVTATVLPATATNKNVIYSSNNSSIVTVSPIGIVTGVSTGVATITVTTVDGGKTATCMIAVIATPVEGISLAGGGTIIVGKTRQLTSTIYPSYATNKVVSYTSSNPTIASVSPTGLVTGLTPGSATITVTTAEGGKTATTNVTVTLTRVSGVSLSTRSLQVRVRGTGSIVATVTPANAPNRTVIWTSLNPRVASVLNGVVTGVAPGSTRIIATTVDGSFAATCTVSVR